MSRFFIAVPVDEAARAEAARLIAELARAGADVKWVEPENLHLTLAFLGNVEDDLLPRAKQALSLTAKSNAPFSLTTEKLGAFGAASRPRVIWLGLGAGAKLLSKLSSELREQLQASSISFDDSRPFAAHLTLGRVRGPRNLERLSAALASIPSRPISFSVDRLILYSSKLSSQGPTHTELAREMLGSAP